MSEEKRQKVLAALTVVKYLLPAILILMGSLGKKQGIFTALSGFLELGTIIMLTGLLIDRHRKIGQRVNNICILILNVQFAVLYFGNTFLSMIMMTNLHAISALKGKAGIYIGTGILILVSSLLPVRGFSFKKKPGMAAFLAFLAGDLLVCALSLPGVSAFYSLGNLAFLSAKLQMRRMSVSQVAAAESGNGREIRYVSAESRQTAYRYPGRKKPDVVLIFTEGCSQNIVDDERDIMPNVRKYEESSLNFTNYYNHTAATYRGIPDQLCSGFTYENMDDIHLPSMQQMFEEDGYETTFINPEPYQKDFAVHLSKMGFDNYISDKENYQENLSDKQMYELVYNTLSEAKEDDAKPQLLVFYTFGTHASMDSPDEQFDDGENAFLNKFYNLDVQFGTFMDKVKADPRLKNTVVIFTTDHATYKDDDFTNTFDGIYERQHGFCDEVPFFIWYNGVKHEDLDAGGRTSLDLASTILDYLGLPYPDTFCGSSLFSDVSGEQRMLETTFTIPVNDDYSSTDGGEIIPYQGDDRTSITDFVEDYCSRARAGE